MAVLAELHRSLVGQKLVQLPGLLEGLLPIPRLALDLLRLFWGSAGLFLDHLALLLAGGCWLFHDFLRDLRFLRGRWLRLLLGLRRRLLLGPHWLPLLVLFQTQPNLLFDLVLFLLLNVNLLDLRLAEAALHWQKATCGRIHWLFGFDWLCPVNDDWHAENAGTK